MKVLLVHRKYRFRGGEDSFLHDLLIPSLKRLQISHELLEFGPLGFESEMANMLLGREKSRDSAKLFSELLSSRSFTHVIFNNIVPTASIALPEIAKKSGTITIQWVHNGRLSCANGLFFNGKRNCIDCEAYGSHRALAHKCYPGSWLQSLAYAWIYRKSRIPKTLAPFIDTFVGSSHYTLKGITRGVQSAGLPAPFVKVIAFPSSEAIGPCEELDLLKIPKPFYAFLGRLSYEKGADRVLKLARSFPDKGFVVAGAGPMYADLKSAAPDNLLLTGFLTEPRKNYLLAKAEAILILSRVPENSPMVIFESHPFKTPIIFPKGGGAEEITKSLGRIGIPLEEFHGQIFPRRTANPPRELADFDLDVKKLFSNPLPCQDDEVSSA